MPELTIHNLIKIAPVISLVLIVIGLIVNNILSLERDKRKERRSHLDSIIKIIYEVRDESLKFHTSIERDISLSYVIVFKINRVDQLIRKSFTYCHVHKNESPSAKKNRNQKLDGCLIDFKRSITLQHFEKGDFGTMELSEEQIIEINATAVNFEFELNDQFDLFHSK
jgi:hypothetical protein